ncbi:MGDG synthase family glycosyltransferase [Metaclostridioides mangenotii]|uniref:MGDG synthase family glycosyltransferase n=1 Tax=Metaclostridioides mangenotii TaxID=1540 RepID=UPI003A5BF090
MYNYTNIFNLRRCLKLKDNNKTILILTAQFGAGHTSAANAIKDYLLDENPDYNIIIRNFITISIPQMNKPMVTLYENNTKYTPVLYNSYYYFRKSVDTKHDISHMLYAPKVSEYISKIKPDIIVSTFPVACGCVNEFKLKNPDADIPSVTVVTDVVDSNEWIYEKTDMYFVPTNEIKNRFVHKGISPDSIKVTGVPVGKRFSSEEKTESQYRYRLLLLGGGRGLFEFDEDFIYWMDSFVSRYKYLMKITIVTGKNHKLYKTLTEKYPLKNIEVLGFVENMYELILNHDLMLTKPGGATLFEAINSKTPVILKYPKVGQEIENAKFIIDKGIGSVYKTDKDLQVLLEKLVKGELDSFIDYAKGNLDDFMQLIHPDKIPDYLGELLK